jgi:tRNA G18 (ribose-2'-O)-methylase SpoU
MTIRFPGHPPDASASGPTLELPDNNPVQVCAVLENIRSLWNVGSMFRSADATGLQALHLCGYTPHPPRDEIDKTALGAVEHVLWQYWTRALDACQWLRARGYQLVALEHTQHSVDVETIELRAPVAFVVGNEVSGVSQPVLSACDATMDIPMYGHKESLNVAVAFGVAAYSLRRRLTSSPSR